MTLKELFEIATEYGADQFRWFARVMFHPVRLGQSAASWSLKIPSRVASLSQPRLAVFLLLNAFVGATIGTTIPGRPPVADRATVAVIVVLVWIAISFLIHVCCRWFGSKQRLESTTIAMVMLLSVVYVVSNLLTFLLVGIGRAVGRFDGDSILVDLIEDPGPVIILVQFVLILTLAPLVLRGLHGFRAWRFVAVGVVSGITTIVLGFSTLANGGC